MRMRSQLFLLGGEYHPEQEEMEDTEGKGRKDKNRNIISAIVTTFSIKLISIDLFFSWNAFIHLILTVSGVSLGHAFLWVSLSR